MKILFPPSRRLAVGFLAGSWFTACTVPTPPPSEFWRPWYEVSDLSDPGYPPEPIPDLASKVDAALPGLPDLSSLDLASVDLRSVDLSSGTPDLATGPDNCSLTVSVTTVSPGGKYSPRNIGAIWISDDGERFIKTLNIWADRRVKDLLRWNAATTAAKVPGDRTDAISGATKSSHGLRTATWNCTDTAKLPVADGPYKVCFELTDYDGAGPYNCVPFTKGPAPLSLSPADSPSFTARKLEFTP